jgi:hypothetical protein
MAFVAADAPRSLGQGSENVMVVPAVVVDGPEVAEQVVERVPGEDPTHGHNNLTGCFQMHVSLLQEENKGQANNHLSALDSV